MLVSCCLLLLDSRPALRISTNPIASSCPTVQLLDSNELDSKRLQHFRALSSFCNYDCSNGLLIAICFYNFCMNYLIFGLKLTSKTYPKTVTSPGNTLLLLGLANNLYSAASGSFLLLKELFLLVSRT